MNLAKETGYSDMLIAEEGVRVLLAAGLAYHEDDREVLPRFL